MVSSSLSLARGPLLVPRGRPILGLGLALVALVCGAQQPLTLEQALQTAQMRSRQLVAQDATATASRELAIAAGQLPDPTLKLGIIDVPVNGADQFSLTRDSFTMGTIGISQEITRSEKRQARTTRFEREAEAAEAGRTLMLANLRRDTAIAWLDTYFQERIRDVLLTQRDETRLQVEAADSAYRGGRGSQADAFAARSAVAVLGDRILQSEQRARAARIKLARWVGEEASRPLASPPELTRIHLDTDLLNADLFHHPQIQYMQRQEQVARADADVAQSNKHADWSVELTYSQRGSAYSNFVSLNVSVPLQWDQGNRQNRDFAAKSALADQLRALREEAVREHRAEANSWLQQWQSDRERLALYDDTLIPLAGDRSRAALAAYRGGGVALSFVLEARRAEIEIRLDQIRLESEAATLWAQLEYLIPLEHAASIRDRALVTRTASKEQRS